jgi:hypothetical protein
MGIEYNQDNWDSGSPLDRFYKDWVELTAEEQASAVELVCYFQETWDRTARQAKVEIEGQTD